MKGQGTGHVCGSMCSRRVFPSVNAGFVSGVKQSIPQLMQSMGYLATCMTLNTFLTIVIGINPVELRE